MNNTYRLLELASSRLGRFAILLIGLAVPPAALFAQGNQTLKKDETVETIRLQLDIDGLAPSAIKVPAGLVQIQVTNGLIVGKAIPIRVFRQNVKLSENKVSKNGTSADSLLRLEPGDYVIEVGGNAQWRSEITVSQVSDKK